MQGYTVYMNQHTEGFTGEPNDKNKWVMELNSINNN